MHFIFIFLYVNLYTCTCGNVIMAFIRKKEYMSCMMIGSGQRSKRCVKKKKIKKGKIGSKKRI